MGIEDSATTEEMVNIYSTPDTTGWMNLHDSSIDDVLSTQDSETNTKVAVDKVQSGNVICTSCHRVKSRRKSVVFKTTNYDFNNSIVKTVFSDEYRQPDQNREYVCLSCDKHLRKKNNGTPTKPRNAIAYHNKNKRKLSFNDSIGKQTDENSRTHFNEHCTESQLIDSRTRTSSVLQSIENVTHRNKTIRDCDGDVSKQGYSCEERVQHNDTDTVAQPLIAVETEMNSSKYLCLLHALSAVLH